MGLALSAQSYSLVPVSLPSVLIGKRTPIPRSIASNGLSHLLATMANVLSRAYVSSGIFKTWQYCWSSVVMRVGGLRKLWCE